MEFHEIQMRGPLNTDNIRASDGTLAATIDDATGKVTFQDEVIVTDRLDALADARVFQNLEVQGPLASFLQSISVGVNATITNNLTVGVDADVGNDLGVGRDINVIRNVNVGDRMQTVNLRMTGSGPAAGKQVQAADALGNLEFGGLPSIPIGSIILFESNTQITGYTLLTDQDDDVVYITKGSVAGGEAGGTDKVGGTWSHLHAVGTITIPAHNHKWYNYVSRGNTYSWASNGSTQIRIIGQSGNTTQGLKGENTSSDARNPITDFWTQDSGAVAATGNTANNTTWRPKGRNFTRQQRSS